MIKQNFMRTEDRKSPDSSNKKMKIGITIVVDEKKDISCILNELKKNLKDLYDCKIVAIGNIAHNKVKKSHIEIVNLNKRIDSGTATIIGMKELLKYDVDYIVNIINKNSYIKYISNFVEALKGADVAFAYYKEKDIFSIFMNIITGSDYCWFTDLKGFRREIAEELVNSRAWNWIASNYHIYSILLSYLQERKIKKIFVKEKTESKLKFEYFLMLPLIIKAARYRLKDLVHDYLGITFNYEEWYRRKRGLQPEEILKRIERAERTSQLLAGSSLLLPGIIGYYIHRFPHGDKLMHVIKGYGTSYFTSSLYRLKTKNKKVGKFLGLLATIVGGALWEYKDSISGKVADPFDVAGDSIGGLISFLITSLYEKKSESLLLEKKIGKDNIQLSYN